MSAAVAAARPVRVLGMGNLLYGDEGLGVLAARALAAGYSFSPAVEVLDGALLGFGVMEVFDRPGPIVVLDALAADAPAGTVYRLPADELLDLAPQIRLMAHEVEPLQQLRLTTALGTAPPTVLVAMTVAEVTMRIGLSPSVTAGFDRFVAAAVTEVERWGVTARRTARVSPAEILADLTASDRSR